MLRVAGEWQGKGIHDIKAFFHGESDALHHGASEVGGGVVEAQSEESTAGGLALWGARSGEVGDENQALGAGGNFGGEVGKMIVGVRAALQAQHVTQPAQRKAA